MSDIRSCVKSQYDAHQPSTAVFFAKVMQLVDWSIASGTASSLPYYGEAIHPMTELLDHTVNTLVLISLSGDLKAMACVREIIPSISRLPFVYLPAASLTSAIGIVLAARLPPQSIYDANATVGFALIGRRAKRDRDRERDESVCRIDKRAGPYSFFINPFPCTLSSRFAMTYAPQMALLLRIFREAAEMNATSCMNEPNCVDKQRAFLRFVVDMLGKTDNDRALLPYFRAVLEVTCNIHTYICIFVCISIYIYI